MRAFVIAENQRFRMSTQLPFTDTYRWFRRSTKLSSKLCARLVGTLVLTLALTACQSDGVEALKTAATEAAPAEQNFGSGPTTLAMLVPLSASGATGRKARDFRDGAALAMSELGNGKAQLTVYDIGAGSGQAAVLGQKAANAGAKLILGPTEPVSLAALANVPAAQRPPVLALMGQSAPRVEGTYALVSDAVDSALEAADIVIGSGRKSFVAVAPAASVAAIGSRLARGVSEAKGEFVGIVPYASTGSALAGELGARKDLFAKAQGVMIFGEGRDPAAVAAALRSISALQPGATIIGNLGWTSDNFASPALEGAIVAMPDQVSLGQIADRYRAAKGRAITIEAAYGYDAVAMAMGIVRVMGPDALTTSALTTPTGFRGATGTFRLRSDGSVERPLSLYRFRGGALELLDAAPVGF